MARLIDADALMNELQSMVMYENDGAVDCGSYNTAIIDAKAAISSAPTLSPDEVRGVVHCKDCKWCHAGYCEKYDDLIPWGCANEPWEDWFCADGKRRETTKEEQDED